MFDEFMEELHKIKDQIINMYSPFKIILFGSLAKHKIKSTSDIDLCIIIDTKDKRGLLQKMYYEVETDYPLDIVIYTVDEWEQLKNEKNSFLYKIQNEGEVIYGG